MEQNWTGRISFMQGKHPEAEEYFNRALAIYSFLEDGKIIERIRRNLNSLATRR